MSNTPGYRDDDKTDYGSTVRDNLMKEPGYRPYCGAVKTIDGSLSDVNCPMLRTRWTGEQFICPCGQFQTSFEPEFIAAYKARWHQDAEEAEEKENA